MAELNFGLINQNLPGEIAGSVQRGREDAVREQMAKQQLLSSQQQTEKTGMEMEQFKRRQAGLDRFISVSAQNGKTGDPEQLAKDFSEYAASTGDANLIMTAQQAVSAAQERARYNREQGFGTPAPAAAPLPAAAPTAAFGASTPDKQSFDKFNNLINMGANPVAAPSSNMLAPTPAAAAALVPTNKLATQAQTPADIQRQIISLKARFPGGSANTQIELLTKQLQEMQKLHVVGENLVSGAGTEVYKGKPKLTQTGQLLAERDALLADGVSPNDPRIKAYSDRLAEGESQTAKLERELQFAIANGASPDRIAQIKSDQRKLHPGLASPVIQGVDANGNTSFTRVAGAGGGPTGTFVVKDQFPTGTARLKIQSTLPTNLPPEVLKQAADQFNFNGKIIPLGSGVQAEVNKIAILTEAAKTNSTDAVTKELNKSYAPALAALAKQEQQVTSYVKTFDKNIDNALETVDKIAKTNVPLINRWLLNPTQRNLTDDPNLKALNIYVSSVQAEFAKIQSGSMGNQVTADAAIKRANDSVNSADSPKAFVAALEAMKQESQNRLSSFGETRNEITTKMRGNKPATPSNQYVEIKNVPPSPDYPNGRKLGKKADGTIEEIK